MNLNDKIWLKAKVGSIETIAEILDDNHYKSLGIYLRNLIKEIKQKTK